MEFELEAMVEMDPGRLQLRFTQLGTPWLCLTAPRTSPEVIELYIRIGSYGEWNFNLSGESWFKCD